MSIYTICLYAFCVVYPLTNNCINRNHKIITCPLFREASNSPIAKEHSYLDPAVFLGLFLLFLVTEGQKKKRKYEN